MGKRRFNYNLNNPTTNIGNLKSSYDIISKNIEIGDKFKFISGIFIEHDELITYIESTSIKNKIHNLEGVIKFNKDKYDLLGKIGYINNNIIDVHVNNESA